LQAKARENLNLLADGIRSLMVKANPEQAPKASRSVMKPVDVITYKNGAGGASAIRSKGTTAGKLL
jgi:hypothetical protein